MTSKMSQDTLNDGKPNLGHLKLSRINQSAIAEVRDRMLSEIIRPGNKCAQIAPLPAIWRLFLMCLVLP